MGEVVNLRRARKARDRSKAAAEADQNRARFGRTKTERARSENEALRRESALDAHRIERPDPSTGG